MTILSSLAFLFHLMFSVPRQLVVGVINLVTRNNTRLSAEAHDDIVHHPLGAGSYIFRDSLIQHLSSICPRDIVIHIGAQPNSSPHMGTIVNFATAFCIASRLARDEGRTASVCLDIVDTAPSQQISIDSVTYQRSQRFTGEMHEYMPDFIGVLDELRDYYGVAYRTRNQADFLSLASVPLILHDIIEDREKLGASFSPRTGRLGIRSACPHDACGWADKHGIRNTYNNTTITFYCPHHGSYHVDYSSLAEVKRLEFNTPLRNIIRARAFSQDPEHSWIRLTGSDYAGYYQEQLLWRHLSTPVVIFYSPLIIDWSGAKLSKSLYVEEGAYQYLKDSGVDYLLSYTKFLEQGRDLRVIFNEVADWVDHPYKLFRPYSVSYIHSVFERSAASAG